MNFACLLRIIKKISFQFSQMLKKRFKDRIRQTIENIPLDLGRMVMNLYRSLIGKEKKPEHFWESIASRVKRLTRRPKPKTAQNRCHPPNLKPAVPIWNNIISPAFILEVFSPTYILAQFWIVTGDAQTPKTIRAQPTVLCHQPLFSRPVTNAPQQKG